jgi:hypothetical protein
MGDGRAGWRGGRTVEAMPPLITDTLLDYFDVTLKPDVDISGLD